MISILLPPLDYLKWYSFVPTDCTCNYRPFLPHTPILASHSIHNHPLFFVTSYLKSAKLYLLKLSVSYVISFFSFPAQFVPIHSVGWGRTAATGRSTRRSFPAQRIPLRSSPEQIHLHLRPPRCRDPLHETTRTAISSGLSALPLPTHHSGSLGLGQMARCEYGTVHIRPPNGPRAD